MAWDTGGGNGLDNENPSAPESTGPSSPDNDSWSRNYQAMGDASARWSAQRPTLEGAGWNVKDLLGGASGVARKVGGYIRDYQNWEKGAPYGSKAPSRGGNFARGSDSRAGGGYESGIYGGYGQSAMPWMNYTPPEGYEVTGYNDLLYAGRIPGMGPAAISVGKSRPKNQTQKDDSGKKSKTSYPSYYTDPITGRVVYSSRLTGGTGNESYTNQRILDALMGTNTASANLAQDIASTEAWIAEVQKAGGDVSPYLSELNRMKQLQMQQGTPVSSPLLDYVNSGMRERVQNEQIDTSMRNSLLASEEAAARRGMGSLGNPMQDAIRSQLGLQGQQAKSSAALASQQQAMADRLNLMNFLKSAEGQTASQNMQRTQIPMTFAEWQERQKEAATDWKNRFKMSDEDWDRQKKVMEMSQRALQEQQRQQEEDSDGFDWGGLAGSIIGSFF